MAAANIPERERVAFGEAVDWSDHRGGVVKFRTGDYTDHDPITPETARKLEAITPVKGHDLMDFDDYVGFAERLVKEMGNRAKVGLMGYMIAPDRDGTGVVIDGIVAVSADDHAFSVKLQRDCFERFRHADQCEADDDHIYVWMD